MPVDFNITGDYLKNGVPVGGGGASGIHALLKPKAGFIVSNQLTQTGLSSSAQTANRMMLAPFIPGNTFTSTNFIMRVFSGVAGSLAKVIIYSDLDGEPNQKLYESTDLDCSTSGTKTIIDSFNFVAGTTYWIAYWGNSNPTVFTISPSNMLNIRNQNVIPTPTNAVLVTIPYGTAPSIITGFNNTANSVPFIGITQ
jgi:hypothetical protein